MKTNDNRPPFSTLTITRMLFISLVLASLLAGFYHAQLINEQKKYARIEDMFVRVRSQLGREETQRLIDLSRAEEETILYEDW